MQDLNLDKLRKEIAQIDGDIIALMARRIELARKVGAYKVQHKMPVKDYRIEKEVIQRNRQRARDVGLYESLAEEISQALIKYAVLAQDEYHQKAHHLSHRSQKRILIVGGRGRMGTWLAQFFSSFHHQIGLFDPTQDTRSCDYEVCADLQSDMQNYDVIVLATPISVTRTYIDQLAEWNYRGLVFDVCSLKSPILDALKRASARGLNITSIHPMFGPEVQLLAGRNIIFCDTGKEQLLQAAWSLFQDTSARLIRMPIEQHDKIMSYVLGLSHLLNLVFAHMLSESGVRMEQLLEAGSSTFLAQMRVSAPVAEENQSLYYEIQAENSFTDKLIEQLQNTLDRFQKAIHTREPEEFKKLMEQARLFVSQSKA